MKIPISVISALLTWGLVWGAMTNTDKSNAFGALCGFLLFGFILWDAKRKDG